LTQEHNMNYVPYMFAGGWHASCCRWGSRCACIDRSIHRHDRNLGRGAVVGTVTPRLPDCALHELVHGVVRGASMVDRPTANSHDHSPAGIDRGSFSAA